MLRALIIAITALSFLGGCTLGGAPRAGLPPLQRVAQIDTDRFAGSWYVIANIPYAAEQGRVAGRVLYRERPDGRFDDIYYSKEGDFDAPEEVLEGVAWVLDPPQNTRWRSRFYWPFLFDFDVLFVDKDYRHLVYGHPSRDYAWIMAREPAIADSRYQQLLAVLRAQGFDSASVLKVPQNPEQLGAAGFQ